MWVIGWRTGLLQTLETVESEGDVFGVLLVRLRLVDTLHARMSLELVRNVEERMLRNSGCIVCF